MIPAYLTNLQLDKVFEVYCSNVDQYIQESTSDEHVVDSQVKRISGFATTTFGVEENAAKEYFSVENPTKNPFSLLQIDNGIIKKNIGPATKKCDCAIVNNSSLCFIEFKTKACSNIISTIEKNYRRAIEQLTATINIFDSYHKLQGVDFRNLRAVEAYICFRNGYPRTTSSQMNYKVTFTTANRGIPLLFDRKKVL